MDLYTYTDLTAQLAHCVGRVAAHPNTQRPVLLADVEGNYVFVDIVTGQSERITPERLSHWAEWTWFPKAIVVLDGLSKELDVELLA
ncbi:MAG: hypothetical protein EBS05_24840 [Proteobacteria bacterium]|jgi:hypothetical protein|nr:hypothetical protein [Pseudomonadota bacterium]